MAIPDYQTCMLTLLRLLKDRNQHRVKHLVGAIADEFSLTDEERTLSLSSGNALVIHNRVSWARTYLGKARLIESPEHGLIAITQRGLDLLAENPTQIDNGLLSRYPEFVEFKQKRAEKAVASRQVNLKENERTPDELLGDAYRDLRVTLAAAVLEQVKQASPEFFERLVVDLLVALRYGTTGEKSGERLGRSGDGGVDGIIKQDRLGLDTVYIQAKRWTDTIVGRPEIQKFVGALKGQKSSKGVFFTTSSFSREARDFADAMSDPKVVLIDGDQLADLMIDSDIGVSLQHTYKTKRVDTDYFEED